MAGMPVTVARLACDEPTARKLAGALDESLGADGTVCAAFEGDGGRWQVAVHFRAPPDAAAVRALVARTAGKRAAKALTFEALADTDWVAQSLAGLPPVRAGRFIVHGAHDRARVPANAIDIEIEAALAFGTGHHGSTRGCLMALDALAKKSRSTPIPPLKGEGRTAAGGSGWGHQTTPTRLASLATLPLSGEGQEDDAQGQEVLDLGTGSGVLAIAAAKLLRRRVIASDIDPVAVAAARGNARRNGAAPTITFARAVGTRARLITARAPYDLIFANILLGPLQWLAVPIRRLSAPHARVVLSGLLPRDANAVLAIYRAQGLTLQRRIDARRLGDAGAQTPLMRTAKAKPPRAGNRGGLRDIRQRYQPPKGMSLEPALTSRLPYSSRL